MGGIDHPKLEVCGIGFYHMLVISPLTIILDVHSCYYVGFAVHASSFGCAWQEAMKAEEEAAIREFQAGNRLQNWALSMIFSICNTDNLSGMRSGETMMLGMQFGWNVLKCLLHVSLYLKICAEFDAFFWVSHVVGRSHPSEFHVECIFVHSWDGHTWLQMLRLFLKKRQQDRLSHLHNMMFGKTIYFLFLWQNYDMKYGYIYMVYIYIWFIYIWLHWVCVWARIGDIPKSANTFCWGRLVTWTRFYFHTHPSVSAWQLENPQKMEGFRGKIIEIHSRLM